MGSNGTSNGHSDFPDKNSEYLKLVVPTFEEEQSQLRSSSIEWKGALPTVESYLRREACLASQNLTRDGGLTPWALAYEPPNSSRRVLCGCETYRKRALVRRNGKVEDQIAYGIGGVFTPTENRGHGYARRMLTELAKRLQVFEAARGEQIAFSALWSDIGKKFYSALGWQAFPSAHVALPAVATVADGLPSVRFLETGDLEELCKLDEQLMRKRLVKQTAANRTSVAMVPDLNTIIWHHARENFVGQEVLGKKPTIRGAIVGEAGSRVWCYWTRTWKGANEGEPDSLYILRLAGEDDSFSDIAPASAAGVEAAKSSAVVKAVAALLAAAQSEAAKWNMGEVNAWNPSSTVLAAAQMLDPAAKVEDRESASISSLLYYGEGNWENVDWIANEKFMWC